MCAVRESNFYYLGCQWRT